MFHHLFKRYKYENTRRYLRLPAAWPVKCTALSASDGQSVHSTQDVSAGGVSMISREMIPVGSRMQVEIHVPPLNRSISLTVVVVRCLLQKDGRFDLGLRFLDFPENERAQLDQAIARYASIRQKESHQKSWWRKVS